MKIDEPYLDIVAKSINQIFEYVSNSNKESFLNNNLLQDACLSRLIVIGEYSIKVSAETKEKFSDVEWQQMKIARNLCSCLRPDKLELDLGNDSKLFAIVANKN